MRLNEKGIVPIAIAFIICGLGELGLILADWLGRR